MSANKKTPNGQSRTPTEEEKIRAVSLLYNRLTRGFTLYLWMTRVHPMLAESPRFSKERFAILAIKNACVESVLLSIRDIDDFFRPRTRKTRSSDLRATDFFGYHSSGPFLSEDERCSINQRIAHLTYEPVWTHTTGIAPEPAHNWDTAELMGKATRSAFNFLEHVERELVQQNARQGEDLRSVRIALEFALKDMEALAEHERSFFAARERVSGPAS